MKHRVALLALLAACSTPKAAPDERAGAPPPSQPSSTDRPAASAAEPAPTGGVASPTDESGLMRGARVRIWHVADWGDETLLEPSSPHTAVIVPTLDIDPSTIDSGPNSPCSVMRVDAELMVPPREFTTLRLSGAEWTRLYVDGVLVARGAEAQAQLDLAPGPHALWIEHAACGALPALRVEWGDGVGSAIVDSGALRAPRELRSGSSRLRSTGVIARWSYDPGAPSAPRGNHPGFELSTPFSAQQVQFGATVRAFAWRRPEELLLLTTGGSVVAANTATRQRGPVVADGLDQPTGIAVLDGRTFVLQAQELTELVDADGDGSFDAYLARWNAWSENEAVKPRALVAWDGALFLTVEGSGPSGRVLRVDPARFDGTLFVELDGAPRALAACGAWLAIVVEGPGCELVLLDAQGERRGRVQLSRPGALPSDALDLLETQARWPRRGPPALVGRGPFAGQLIVNDPPGFGLLRVALESSGERVIGSVFELQGAREVAFPASRELWLDGSFTASGPDGAVWLAGGRKAETGGDYPVVQRLAPRDASVFEPLALRVHRGALEIAFSAPLAPGSGWSSDDYRVAATASGAQSSEELALRSVWVSEDRRRVVLELDGLTWPALVEVRLGDGLVGEDGTRPWGVRGWTTISGPPAARAAWIDAALGSAAANAEALARRAGWRVLLGREDLGEWSAAALDGWRSAEGELGGGGGSLPLVSKATFDDFELEFEWNVARGGAGAIGYRGGAKYALVDEQANVGGRDPLRLAGAALDERPPLWRSARPAGEWNRARIVARGDQVEHWLNGVKVLERELDRCAGPIELSAGATGVALRSMRIRVLEE